MSLFGSLFAALISFSQAASAVGSAKKTIDIGNDSFTCEETHRVLFQSAAFGQSVSQFSFCKSASGKTGFYNPAMESVVVVSGNQVQYKSLKSNSALLVPESDAINNTLSAFVSVEKSSALRLRVVDSKGYQEASQLALLQLKKVRSESLSKARMPNEIKVDGIDGKNGTLCKRESDREPLSSDDWYSFGVRSCGIYSCQSGSKKLMVQFASVPGTIDIVVPVESLDGNNLGKTYKASRVSDANGKVLAESKMSNEPYSPEMVATYGNVPMSKFLRTSSYAPCKGKKLDTFRKQYDAAIKRKGEELAEMDTSETFQDANNALEKITKPSSGCDTKKNGKSQPPPLDIPPDKSVITEELANELFKEFKSRPDIPQYTPVGCEARAHVISSELDSKGYFTEKIFIQADNLVPVSSGPPVQWGAHVASVVSVLKSNGLTERMVFDTALFDKPVSIDTWLNHIKRPDGHKILWSGYPPPSPSSLTESHRAGVSITPWTVYWPNEAPAMTDQDRQKLLTKATTENQIHQLELKKIKKSYFNTDF